MKMRKKYYSILCFFLLLAYHSTPVDGGCGGDDVCKCNQKECRVTVRPNACKPIMDACKGMKFKENQCQRRGGYYSWAGTICQHDKDAGNCDDFEKLVTAINFGGKEHTDVNGITYEADPNTTVKSLDTSGMRRLVEKMDCEIVGVPEEDKPLYESYVTSDQQHIKKFGRGSVGYRIPMKGHKPGEYELTLKIVEPQYNEPYKRNFDMSFGTMEFSKATDIVSYAGTKGQVFELHLPFTYIEVDGKPEILHFGRTESKPDHFGSPLVQFFSGECGEDSIFVASAVSIKYWGKDWKPSGKPKPKTTKKPGPKTTTKKTTGGDDDDYTTPQHSDEDYGEGAGKKKPTTKKAGKATTQRPHTLGCKAKEPTKPGKEKSGGKTTKKPAAEESEEGGPIGGRSAG